jgi:hypothetical protein
MLATAGFLWLALSLEGRLPLKETGRMQVDLLLSFFLSFFFPDH